MVVTLLCMAAVAGLASASEPRGARQNAEVRLRAREALALASDLEQSGQAAAASQLLLLLSRDPDLEVRAQATALLARQAMNRNDWRDAAILLRRILDVRPNAAPVRLALAQVLTELGDEGAALRELRAAQSIGLPLAVARMVDRFSEALRARRPLGGSFELAIAPDSNINTATASDTLGTVIGDFDIDPGGKEKSGVGAAFRGSLFARQAVGAKVALLGRASVSADLYRDKDFNQIAFDLGAGPELQFGPVRLNLEAGATRRWYGVKLFEDSVRGEVNGSVATGRRSTVRARLSAARINNHLNDLQDGSLYASELGFERALDARSGVGLSLGLSRADLGDPGYSTRSWRTQLLGWREFGRITAHASASMGRLVADERLALFPDKREDRSWRLSAGATMRQWQIRGFAPLIRYTWERNVSTIAFYDYSRRRAEFGIVRAF